MQDRCWFKKNHIFTQLLQQVIQQKSYEGCPLDKLNTAHKINGEKMKHLNKPQHNNIANFQQT